MGNDENLSDSRRKRPWETSIPFMCDLLRQESGLYVLR
jgi:hypothetical protein